MYEPKRLPSLTAKTIPVPDMKYGLFCRPNPIDIDDPTLDPLHIHEYLEIFYNLGDEVSFLVNGTLYPVAKGEILINRPGDVHVCIFPRSAVYDYGCLWIDADFSSPIFSFLKKEDFSPLLSFPDGEEGEILALLAELDEIKEKESESARAVTVLLSILSELGRRGTEKKQASLLPKNLTEILRYINEGFTEIANVTDVAEKFFISPSTLNRYFRTHLRTTPREYVEAKRLALAMELLKGGASVTEASAEAGFPDCSHFIVLFKKKFGKTPLRYKKDAI